MTCYFTCDISEKALHRSFKNFDIQHKSKFEYLTENQITFYDIGINCSIQTAMRKYQCGKNLTIRIRKEFNTMFSKKMVKALNEIIHKNNYYSHIQNLYNKIKNSKEDWLFYDNLTDFPKEIWIILVSLFGDTKDDLANGWLNIHENKNVILCFLISLEND